MESSKEITKSKITAERSSFLAKRKIICAGSSAHQIKDKNKRPASSTEADIVGTSLPKHEASTATSKTYLFKEGTCCTRKVLFSSCWPAPVYFILIIIAE